MLQPFTFLLMKCPGCTVGAAFEGALGPSGLVSLCRCLPGACWRLGASKQPGWRSWAGAREGQRAASRSSQHCVTPQWQKQNSSHSWGNFLGELQSCVVKITWTYMYKFYICILFTCVYCILYWVLAEPWLRWHSLRLASLCSFPIFPVISGKHLSSHSSSSVATSRARPACASQHRSAVAGLQFHLAFKDLLKINKASRALLVDQV